jgi:predicted PurR-regulated permease PerM
MLTDLDHTLPAPVDPERKLRLLVMRLLAAFLAVSLFALIFLVFPWWTGFPMVTITVIVSAGLILAAAIGPLAQLGRCYKIPAAVTIVSIFLGALALISLVTFMVTPLMSTQVQIVVGQLRSLVQTQLPQLWLAVKPFLLTWDPALAKDIDDLVGQSVKAAVGYVSYVGVFADVIANFVGSMATLGGYSIFALLLCYYFVAEPELLNWPAQKFLPTRAEVINRVIMRVYTDIGCWARWQLGLSLFFGCTFGCWLQIGQWLFGGQWNGATIGLLGGFVDIIPFGNALAIGLSLLTQISQHNWYGVLWVVAGAFVVVEIEWHILAPRTMGHALRIHPLLILLFVFGGFLWKGMLGGLGAIPALIVVRAVVMAILPSNEKVVQVNLSIKQYRFLKWRNCACKPVQQP